MGKIVSHPFPLLQLSTNAPPSGRLGLRVRSLLIHQKNGKTDIFHSSGDSTGATVSQSESSYDKLFDKKPKNILALNHETEKGTVDEVLPYVLQKYKDAGYQFVTVAECLEMDPYISK